MDSQVSLLHEGREDTEITLVKISAESHYKAAQSSKLTVDIKLINGALINVKDFTNKPRYFKQKIEKTS